MKIFASLFFLFCFLVVSSNAQWASPSSVRGQFGTMTATKMTSIPDFALPAIYSDRTAHPLPAVVNHETDAVAKPYMPPVNWCIDGWCCSNASGTSFSYDYAVQVEKKITSATAGSKPLMTYNYTYHFMNNANQSTGGDGFMYVESFDILKATGGATSTDFGGFDGAVDQSNAWMSGYDKYYNAMKVRIDEYYKIDCGAAGADEKIKQIVYDAANGTPEGAILSLMANSEFMPTTQVNGRKTFTSLGGGGGHALAICGYDNAHQGGSWLIQAQWGTGDYWLPFTMLHSGTSWYGNPAQNKYVMFCRIKKNYTPKFAFKVTVTHSQRNQVCLMVGAANSTSATQPSVSKDCGNAFNYGGGSIPMCGSGKSSTIEIGFDLTDFASVVVGGQGTFFFRAMSKGGSGTVNSLSLMDYNGSTVREIPCSQSNVAMSSSTVLRIPWTGTTTQEEFQNTIKAHQGNGLQAAFTAGFQAVKFTFPRENMRSSTLQIRDLSGRTVFSTKAFTNAASETSWDLRDYLGRKVSPGTYIASVNLTGLDGTSRQLTTKVMVKG
jgi:hypothetical protein